MRCQAQAAGPAFFIPTIIRYSIFKRLPPYKRETQKIPFWADLDKDVARGFRVMKETGGYTVEVSVMAVSGGPTEHEENKFL